MAPSALRTEASKDAEAGFSTESAPWQRATFDGEVSLKRKVIAAAAATFGVLLLVVSACPCRPSPLQNAKPDRTNLTHC